MFTEKQIAELENQIDTSVVKKREGPRGMMLSYIPGFYAIDTANEIFGFDGWSYEIEDLKSEKFNTEVPDKYKKDVVRPCIEVRTTARVKVTINDIVRSDVGHGNSQSYTDIPDYEFSEKEAVTDALKRALRSFGNRFGNSLYDKDFLETIDTKPVRTEARAERTEAPVASAMKPASQKQRDYIEKLLKEKNKSLADFSAKTIATLSASDASDIITKLQA